MSILALDLGTKCGYAICRPGPAYYLNSGTWGLKPTRFDSAGQKFVKFRKNLTDIILKEEPTLIVFEEVRMHMAIDAAHSYGGFLSVLQLCALDFKVEYRGVGVGTIKKHATGKGNAKKPDMIKAAIRLYPAINVIDDNHADALCLLHYATHELLI